MSRILIRTAFVILLITAWGFYMPNAPRSMYLALMEEDPERAKVLMELVMQGLKVRHYEELVLDDDFSENVFDLYIKRLDFGKRFLTAEDVKSLEKHRSKVDDQISAGSFILLDESTEILKKRVEQARGYYQEILDEPFDFSRNEHIETDRDKLKFSKDAKELKDFWRKSLKYQTLSQVRTMVKIQNNAKKQYEEGTIDTLPVEKSFQQMEEEARSKVRESTKDLFERMDKIDYRDRLSYFINSVLNSIDPHTSYFPPQDKENFDISMSGRLEGIGAQLREQDGYVKVQAIVPGSASWKQGELKAGDIILKVGQGEAEPVDVVDVRIDFAVKLIRGPKGTEVRLTVKKLDGTILVVPIIRDVVILEETYAKSAVLESGSKKVGYVKLPKFYADFNRVGGRNCSDDVKKEVARLKEDGIGGIIIDLRNNSGGSLDEAVKIAGLFIESGPVVQAKGRRGDPYVFRDKDNQVVYNGPVVVLVNSFSASASEILAAAIQDYGRGVIIGSQTYGKGTVQTFMELDRFVPSNFDDVKPLGAIKLTIQKFYRINGDATQLKGVTPDIILPDNYSNVEIGERELDHVMAWNEIAPVRYSKWSNIKIPKLRESSIARVSQDSTFSLIGENAKRLGRNDDKTSHTLNYVKFMQEQDALDEEAKRYRDLQKMISGLDVSSLYEAPSDTTQLARQQDFHKALGKDVYLQEAISVIADLQ